MSAVYEPQITAFTCRYCGGVPADMAGSERLTYPANIKIVSLPCTGRLDAQYVLAAFEQGADGVCVFACGPDNCHHLTGSRRAAKRVEYVKGLLAQIGLPGERLEIVHLGIGQAREFVHVVTDMTERLRALGPSPLK
jgi:F420-non-reducing hydrogenase iron-sulfur subunit